MSYRTNCIYFVLLAMAGLLAGAMPDQASADVLTPVTGRWIGSGTDGGTRLITFTPATSKDATYGDIGFFNCISSLRAKSYGGMYGYNSSTGQLTLGVGANEMPINVWFRNGQMIWQWGTGQVVFRRF